MAIIGRLYSIHRLRNFVCVYVCVNPGQWARQALLIKSFFFSFVRFFFFSFILAPPRSAIISTVMLKKFLVKPFYGCLYCSLSLHTFPSLITLDIFCCFGKQISKMQATKVDKRIMNINVLVLLSGFSGHHRHNLIRAKRHT